MQLFCYEEKFLKNFQRQRQFRELKVTKELKGREVFQGVRPMRGTVIHSQATS